MRVDAIFECRCCGSPAVSLPINLTVADIVRCAGCGSELGTWQDYKNAISFALVNSGTPLSADPILLPIPNSISLPDACAAPPNATVRQVSGPQRGQADVVAPARIEAPQR